MTGLYHWRLTLAYKTCRQRYDEWQQLGARVVKNSAAAKTVKWSYSLEICRRGQTAMDWNQAPSYKGQCTRFQTRVSPCSNWLPRMVNYSQKFRQFGTGTQCTNNETHERHCEWTLSEFASTPTKQWLPIEVDNELVIHFLLSLTIPHYPASIKETSIK